MNRRDFPWIVVGMLFAGGALADEVAFVRAEPSASIQSGVVAEASGLAVSSRAGGFMWIINDSGAQADLHLFGRDGVDHGQVRVEGAVNVDWEDLSSFELDGKPYLLIADSGDNLSRRNDCVLYVVEEPALPAAGEKLSGTVKVAWKIPFSFEDGPRDCESVAVDARVGKIILVSKRTKPPVVYELPLRPQDGTVVAKRLGETTVAPPKGVPMLPYIAQPTGMDLTRDGSAGVLVSYYGVFLFPRTGKESWGEAFAKLPVFLGPHGMAQAESVGFSKDGKTLTLLSERGDKRIVVFSR
ncbi:hypothetical protein OVA24_06525 [Luteolibacter sp. SL250]|uniref:hypothetical protein n=1 Tax=Luteolibacter sp. SL250 TaxID=2995170 RepID=UPI0022718EFD|nr:hypothetical protein [Luteolibacter sp. SL250]WAC21037.1 hypothetical protein OVA24_06525 [Luteolibacter sp. SL250]